MSVSICVASGKGGAGKSVVTANLGAILARRGYSVVIIDMDIGLRSQDALLSLENQVVYDLVDVASKDCKLEQALLPHPAISGLSLLPAAQFARVRALAPERLRKILKGEPAMIFLKAERQTKSLPAAAGRIVTDDVVQELRELFGEQRIALKEKKVEEFWKRKYTL